MTSSDFYCRKPIRIFSELKLFKLKNAIKDYCFKDTVVNGECAYLLVYRQRRIQRGGATRAQLPHRPVKSLNFMMVLGLKGAVPPPGKISEYAPVYSLFDGFFFNLKLGHDSDIDLTLNIFSRLEYSVSCFKFLFIIYNSEHTLILSFHILQF